MRIQGLRGRYTQVLADGLPLYGGHLPRYRRVNGRPRLFWDDGRGKSLLIAAGGLAETRSGGTMPGRAAPDGRPFLERLDTARVDGGVPARVATASGHVVAARGSVTEQRHTHTFGTVIEDDAHRTMFGELSVTGTAPRQTWVAGAALQRERYVSEDVPGFDYVHTVPGVFVQDEIVAAPWLTLAGSGEGSPYVLFGGLIDWAIGKSRVFLNVENLGDVRQTREHPLVRRTFTPEQRWTVDAWAPLEGRTLNAGIRLRF